MQASQDAFEASVKRVQRFVRRRQGGGLGDVAGSGRNPNVIRRLKRWLPPTHAEWKQRRREGGVIIFDFLKDARLSHNLKAIYKFRRKVVR